MQIYNESNIRQLRAIRLRFRHNWRGFFRRFRLPLICLAVAAMLDALSTCRFMLILGVDNELHPYIRLISQILGPIWGPLAGKALQCVFGVCGVVYVRRYAHVLLWAAVSSYSGAAFLNVFGMRLLVWLER